MYNLPTKTFPIPENEKLGITSSQLLENDALSAKETRHTVGTDFENEIEDQLDGEVEELDDLLEKVEQDGVVQNSNFASIQKVFESDFEDEEIEGDKDDEDDSSNQDLNLQEWTDEVDSYLQTAEEELKPGGKWAPVKWEDLPEEVRRDLKCDLQEQGCAVGDTLTEKISSDGGDEGFESEAEGDLEASADDEESQDGDGERDYRFQSSEEQEDNDTDDDSSAEQSTGDTSPATTGADTELEPAANPASVVPSSANEIAPASLDTSVPDSVPQIGSSTTSTTTPAADAASAAPSPSSSAGETGPGIPQIPLRAVPEPNSTNLSNQTLELGQNTTFPNGTVLAESGHGAGASAPSVSVAIIAGLASGVTVTLVGFVAIWAYMRIQRKHLITMAATGESVYLPVSQVDSGA